MSPSHSPNFYTSRDSKENQAAPGGTPRRWIPSEACLRIIYAPMRAVPSPKGLMDLPLEIRRQIYHEALVPLSGIVRSIPKSRTVDKEFNIFEDSVFPPSFGLFNVSKQVQKESVQVLAQSTTLCGVFYEYNGYQTTCGFKVNKLATTMKNCYWDRGRLDVQEYQMLRIPEGYCVTRLYDPEVLPRFKGLRFGVYIGPHFACSSNCPEQGSKLTSYINKMVAARFSEGVVRQTLNKFVPNENRPAEKTCIFEFRIMAPECRLVNSEFSLLRYYRDCHYKISDWKHQWADIEGWKVKFRDLDVCSHFFASGRHGSFYLWINRWRNCIEREELDEDTITRYTLPELRRF